MPSLLQEQDGEVGASYPYKGVCRKMSNTTIDWEYPQPRSGLSGMLDRFFGPGTTRAEAWLQGIFSVAAGFALPLYAFLKHLNWSPVQYVVAALLAFDCAGGIVTNASSSAKRWYHRPGRGFGDHFSFVAFHVVYVFLVAWIFRSMDWAFFAVVALYLLGAAYLVLKTQLYLRRPLAFALLAFSFLLNTYAFAPTPGLEWFVPFLFLKLIVSHLLREEPYRPDRPASLVVGE
jgi:hypothetical protein